MYLGFSLGLVLGAAGAWLIYRGKKKQLQEAIVLKEQSAINFQQAAAAFQQASQMFEDQLTSARGRAYQLVEELRKCEKERDWLKANQNLTVNCTSTEEHLQAERGRADRLAEALRKSEDERERLAEELRKLNANGPRMVQAREWGNIFRYDGTAAGQEELTDA